MTSPREMKQPFSFSSLRRGLTVVLLCIALAGCHRSPTEPTEAALRIGKWAGPQIEITVSANQVVFTTTSCLRGYFASPTIGRDGRFIAEASLQPIGGPPPPSEFLQGRINGVLNGTVLAISVRYDSGATIGPFEATYLGASPTFYPCPP